MAPKSRVVRKKWLKKWGSRRATRKGAMKSTFRKRKRGIFKGKAGKFKARKTYKKKRSGWKRLYKMLMPKTYRNISDANVQALINVKAWAIIAPSLTPSEVTNMVVSSSISNDRQMTAGTNQYTVPQRIIVRKSTTRYYLKNVAINPARVRVHSFIVRENMANQTASGSATNSIGTIFTQGNTLLSHIDAASTPSISLPGYEWYHNRWFCSWFKHVGKVREYILRPQDPAKRFTLPQPKDRIFNSEKAVPLSYYKGTRFHLLEFIGDMCGDTSVVWTGTGTTSKGGPGPMNVHMNFETDHQYATLYPNDVPTYEVLDSRSLQVTSNAACIPAQTFVSSVNAASAAVYMSATGSVGFGTSPPVFP